MITFKVDYFGQREGEPRKYSHSYDESWEPTPYYCPHCGKRTVWHEMSGGDYYVGEQYLCTNCAASFELPSGAEPREDHEQDTQRLAAIRAANQEGTKPADAVPCQKCGALPTHVCKLSFAERCTRSAIGPIAPEYRIQAFVEVHCPWRRSTKAAKEFEAALRKLLTPEIGADRSVQDKCVRDK